MEAFARRMLKALCVYAAASKNRLMFRSEVFPYHTYDPDLGEVTGREREVRSGATQASLALSLGRFDGVKCNTADDKYGHESLSLQELYLLRSRSSFLRVASGIASLLVRIAYLSALAQAQDRSPGMAATVPRT